MKCCPDCKNILTEEMIEANLCWNCGRVLDIRLMDDEDRANFENTYGYVNKKIVDDEFYTTTASRLEGYKIIEQGGVITCDAITDLFISDNSSYKELLGDSTETGSYTTADKITLLKNQLLTELIKKAKKSDANAVIGIRYSVSQIGQFKILVSIEGTAVKVC